MLRLIGLGNSAVTAFLCSRVINLRRPPATLDQRRGLLWNRKNGNPVGFLARHLRDVRLWQFDPALSAEIIERIRERHLQAVRQPLQRVAAGATAKAFIPPLSFIDMEARGLLIVEVAQALTMVVKLDVLGDEMSDRN